MIYAIIAGIFLGIGSFTTDTTFEVLCYTLTIINVIFAAETRICNKLDLLIKRSEPSGSEK